MTGTPLDLLDDADTAGWADPDAGLGVLAAADGSDTLPLAALDVCGRLDGLTARVEVTQTFVNTLGRPVEAAYVFPLPDRAAVTAFRLEATGRVVEGEFRERPPPGMEPDRGPPPAGLAEDERAAVFAVRAGVIPADDRVTVRLTLVGPLPAVGGDVEYRFPLSVALRYTPGRPIPGPPVGAAAGGGPPPVWLGNYPNPVRLTLALDVDPAGLGAAGFRSSQPAVLSPDGPGGVRRVSLAAEGRVDRAFVLRYRLGGPDVRAALQLAPDEPGASEGTFALTVVPPAGGEGRARDVVFALDRSAAMRGWRVAAARRAVARMVEALGPGDRFAVLGFDDRVAAPPRFGGARLVPADGPHRAHAIDFLDRLSGRDAPADVAAALGVAAGLLTDPDLHRDRVLVLVTAAAVPNEEHLLRVWAGSAEGARALCLGVDQGVSVGFLRRLAEFGGACELADTPDRLAAAADRLQRRLAAPRLAGLTLAASGFEVVEGTVVPGRAPDLYPGAAAVIRGRYAGPPAGGMTVAATTADGRPWVTTVEARAAADPAVTAAWARGHVRELEDRHGTGGGNRGALEQQAIAASLRHQVPSRFTAFAAVERAARPPAPRAATTVPDVHVAPPRRGAGAKAGRYAAGDEPIHGFTLVDILNRGQFGEVWKARDNVTGKHVAIKITDLTLSPTAPKELRALNLLKNLNHPNLVPILTARVKDAAGREVDFDHLDGPGPRPPLAELVIAMGLGEKSLADRLREANPDHTPDGRKGLPVAELVRYARGAAKGIDYLNRPAHGLGAGDGPIVHGDVKPKNMMVVAGEVQVAGAGFARIISADARQTRATGSPAYSSPEVLSNQPVVGSDQYALAISYYELRTGRLPFPDEASLQQIILAHALGDLDLSSPVLSDAEREVLRRATARVPADRFETCEEFVEELAALPEVRELVRASRRPAKAGEVVDVYRPAGSSPSITARGPGPAPSQELTDIDLDAAPSPAAPATPRPSDSVIEFAEFGPADTVIPTATPPVIPEPPPAAVPPADPDAPALDPEIAAILRAAVDAPSLVPPAASPDLGPEPDPEIAAILRGAAPPPAPPPPPPPPPPPAPAARAAPRPAPPPPPPPPAPTVVEKPAAPPPVPPVPAQRKGLGLPVDPADPLGRRYATGVPDEEIQKIISESQRIAVPQSRVAPPAPPAAPPPPPEPAAQEPPGARQTAALPEDEIQKIIAESRRLADRRDRRKSSPPPPPPPPEPPRPREEARKPAPPRPGDTPSPAAPAPQVAEEPSSKPEWYREAVREQHRSSGRQVRAAGAAREPREQPPLPPGGAEGRMWLLLFLGLVLAVAAAIVLVVLIR